MYMPGWAMGACMLIGSWWDRMRASARIAIARDWPVPGDRWATLTDEVEVIEVGPRGGRLAVLVSIRKDGRPAGSWWLAMPAFHARIRGLILTQRGGDHG